MCTSGAFAKTWVRKWLHQHNPNWRDSHIRFGFKSHVDCKIFVSFQFNISDNNTGPGLKGINDFSLQFGKIISRYRRIGYNLNVMRQSACLVFNPIMVDNYAAFFNCTPVGQASDSMMAPT